MLHLNCHGELTLLAFLWLNAAMIAAWIKFKLFRPKTDPTPTTRDASNGDHSV